MNATVDTSLLQDLVDNNVEEVKGLLATGGINVNTVGEYGKTPLHVAAEIGNLEVVEALVKYTPTDRDLREVDVNAADQVGSTALHYAVAKGHEPVVRFLLGRGSIKPNIARNDGKTPLHVAAEIGNLELVEALVEYTNKNLEGGKVLNATDNVGSTALHYAVDKERKSVVRFLLGRAEIDPNIAERNDSKTPLHIAAEKGNLDIFKEFVNGRHAIDVDAGDRFGNTALHYAAIGENEAVVEELLRFIWKAPTRVEKLKSSENQRRSSPLHLAALFGRHKIVSKLIAAGLPVNNTTLSTYTPLHFAVLSGSWRTVKVLLKESKDLKVSEPDWRGFTPVQYARQACLAPRNEFRPPAREDAQRMVQMLEGFDLEGLRNDRGSYIDSANAILVGAALIASIAFASWLQPPLGFQVGTDSYSNVYFHGAAMKSFWIFNSLSFFCAIASFITGADAALPQRFGGQAETVKNVRIDVIRASKFLFVAVVCIILAFICAGFADLPSVHNNVWYMIVPGVVGGFLCVYALRRYFIKIRDAQDSGVLHYFI